MNLLEPKWNPLQPQPEDHEGAPEHNVQLSEKEVMFDPNITTHGNLGDVFRIFTEELEGGPSAPNTRLEPEPDEQLVTVYTDGSATNNGKANARAGAGAYYAPNDNRNMAIRIPEELLPSNQTAEIIAIKETIESNPKDVPLKIMSDSKYVIEGLTKNLRRWEDEGFYGAKNGHLIKTTVASVSSRTVSPWTALVDILS